LTQKFGGVILQHYASPLSFSLDGGNFGTKEKWKEEKRQKKVEVKDRMGLRSHSFQFHEKKFFIY
jgi:hypothetical protein